MKKLVDIKDRWEISGKNNFNDEDMWEGKLLLEDDGWFEGIVVDKNSYYTEDRFIFGVYHPEKVIELFKFTPIAISSPFVFHGKRNEDGYFGFFEEIGLFGSIPCGASLITAKEKESTKKEVEELENRIQSYKDSMDKVGREFYGNSIAMRNSMCQIILRNYEGRGFTDEEKEEIMEECRLVNERVVKSTVEETKRLVKNLFDDDELPF